MSVLMIVSWDIFNYFERRKFCIFGLNSRTFILQICFYKFDIKIYDLRNYPTTMNQLPYNATKRYKGEQMIMTTPGLAIQIKNNNVKYN